MTNNNLWLKATKIAKEKHKGKFPCWLLVVNKNKLIADECAILANQIRADDEGILDNIVNMLTDSKRLETFTALLVALGTVISGMTGVFSILLPRVKVVETQPKTEYVKEPFEEKEIKAIQKETKPITPKND